MSEGNTTIMVERWLAPLGEPDSPAAVEARNELIQHTQRRMQAICRRMFFNSLRNTGAVDWEDVYQEAALKLWQTIASAQPTTPREYFMLATKKIREVSLDLCRKFAREVVPFEGDAEKSFNPLTSAKWTEFHEQVQKLDDKHREVFELLWYHELTQQEVAGMLGVDVSTIKNRWRAARASLAEFAP